MKISLNQLEKLIDNNYKVKIDTPSGYEQITSTYRKHSTGRILTFDDGSSIKCSDDHLMLHEHQWCPAKNFTLYDNINNKQIINIEPVPSQDWIDFSIDADHESYIHNDIVHHNSGKSLALYALIRYHLEHNRQILLIVPRSSLVTQMFTDFEDYSSANGWNVDRYVHQLYSGQPKEVTKPVLLSTWQSLFKLPKSWFDKQKFDVVIVDEAHTAAATSLTSILEKLPNTKYRLGTTGTISNTKTNLLVLTGLFGPVYKAISTKQLMDRNQVSQLKIKQLMLNYPDEYRKVISKLDYQKEIDFLVSNTERNKFIVNLALATTGNTLILSQYIEKHLDILHEMLQNKAVNRKVFYIHGKVDVAEREEIRQILEQESNAIVCASFGTMSTGVNAPSIENIIFASPSKSSIRVLQSVGRGLRLKEGKDFCTLFDIGDNLSWKSKFNHTMRHAVERYKIYCQEQFNVKITEVNLN